MVTGDGTVDVVMLTKNSDRRLKKCLNSVYRNIPVGTYSD